ncbi:MAG TPA: multicopper oxidase domain-containing protein [Chloroflexota bacterium]|nr:multicopper oxidase domain-containing protein [Chloroflexota bacterium]
MRRRLLPLALTVSAAAAVLAASLGAAAAPTSAGLTTVSCTPSCDLYAKSGTINLPGYPGLQVYGYALAPDTAALVPGPTILATQGAAVTVRLHNMLAEPSGLVFAGQTVPTDPIGVPANGGMTAYTFTPSQPGTSIYEASLTSGGPRQVAMGLSGALVVKPTGTPPNQDEALVILTEIDPAFNASPATYDLRKFSPKFGLINGKIQSANDRDLVATSPGRTVQLRYVNASLRERSVGVLGLHQTVLAADGLPLLYPYQMVAETIPAGATLDTLVTIPMTATNGSRFAVHNGTYQLHNAGVLNTDKTVTTGGMLSFIRVDVDVINAPGDTTGPVSTNVVASPNPADGTGPVSVTANVNDATTGGSGVAAAEMFINQLGANGSSTLQMTLTAVGQTASATRNIQISDFPKDALGNPIGGNYTILVHGQDGAGNWGAVASTTLALAVGGPTTTGVSVTPSLSNGSLAIAVSASASDATTGSQNVVAGEFFVDTVGTAGSGTAMTPSTTGPVVALNGSIQPVTPPALAEGTHLVSVHAQDSLKAWGPYATASLRVDKTGPAVVGAVSVSPSPNNGKQSYDTTPPPADGGSPPPVGVRISATVTDPLSGGINSRITAVEAFVDVDGTPGTGLQFVPSDGFFDSPTESGYATLPLTALATLPDGRHPILVHAQDAAGNWGLFTNGTLILDRLGPVVSGVKVSAVGTDWRVTATATDAATNVVAAEFYEGADPGVGLARPMSGAFTSLTEAIATPSITLANGSHTLHIRALDAQGHWGAAVATPAIDPIFLDSFESGTLAAWSSNTNALPPATPALTTSTAAAMSPVGTYGMQAAIATGGATTAKYVTDTTPAAERSYHGRFFFDPRGTISPNGHDILTGASNASGSATIFRVQYRRLVVGTAISYQVRVGALIGGTMQNSVNWYTITNAAHSIQIAWQSATVGGATLYVDGTQVLATPTGNTSASTLQTVRLGPQNITAGTAAGLGAAGEYLDAYVSTRTLLIDP